MIWTLQKENLLDDQNLYQCYVNGLKAAASEIQKKLEKC